MTAVILVDSNAGVISELSHSEDLFPTNRFPTFSRISRKTKALLKPFTKGLSNNLKVGDCIAEIHGQTALGIMDFGGSIR